MRRSEKRTKGMNERKIKPELQLGIKKEKVIKLKIEKACDDNSYLYNK